MHIVKAETHNTKSTEICHFEYRCHEKKCCRHVFFLPQDPLQYLNSPGTYCKSFDYSATNK